MRLVSLVFLILLSSIFTGCFAEEENEFDWADPIVSNCELNYDLTCVILFQGTGTPHHAVVNPATNELWIIYLSGIVKIWAEDQLIDAGDLTKIVNRCHTEQGLLGFVFDSNYNSTKQVLLSYVENGDCEGKNTSDLVLASAKVFDSDNVIDIDTIEILKRVEQPYRNHNGGHLHSIGNGNYLWGIGDGGSSNDPDANGQNDDDLLGSIVYFEFSDNQVDPVMNPDSGDSFILHYGLRNPWKFDVDQYERLWIADVGQNCWEEVNLVDLENKSNLGWSDKEGFSEFSEEDGCNEETWSNDEEYTDPIFVYDHQNGNCSITGGYWTNDPVFSDGGGFLFGDFCSGSLWIISDNNDSWKETYLGSVGGLIVGFGEGPNDELLVFFWTGEIIQIIH